MKIQIEFGGFYHSWHSDIIDNNIESLQEFNEYESYNLHKLFDNFVKNGSSFDKARSKVIEKVTYEKNKYNDANINWSKTYQSYIENYCYQLENYILDEYDVNIDFKNISLYSPKEYNFRTDEIECVVIEKQSLKLLNMNDNMIIDIMFSFLANKMNDVGDVFHDIEFDIEFNNQLKVA